jgi:SAM-dependent methyltransferase
MELCSIKYLLQPDASRLDLPSGSVDYQVSRSVFEHVPPDDLVRLLRECNRVVRDDGLFINVVDFTDHFSHSDRSISNINFLRFSDKEWRRIAGNRYAYANRLRLDDLLALLEKAGHRQVDLHCVTDDSLGDLLSSGEPALDRRFMNKTREVLATVCASVVSEKDNKSQFVPSTHSDAMS